MTKCFKNGDIGEMLWNDGEKNDKMPEKNKNDEMFQKEEKMPQKGGKCLKMTQKIMTKCLKRTKNDEMFQKEQRNESEKKVTSSLILCHSWKRQGVLA